MEVLKHVEPEKFSITDYKKFVLVGDIGGSHLSLAVFGIDDSYHKIFSTRGHTKDHADPIQPINETLKNAYEIYGIAISDAVFAAAGPVINERKQIRLTNAGMLVDAGQILLGTMLGRVALINDVEALGYGVSIIDKENIEQILGGVYLKGTDFVAAAGTGLGACINIIDPISKRQLVVATEAGHISFPAQNEFRLAGYINKKFGNAEYEHIISGKGLENLYNLLKSESPREKEILKAEDKPAMISRCALSNNDARCVEAVKLLFYYLGKFVADMTILSLANNVYLGGGVVTHNLPLLKEAFLKGFLEKGRWKEHLSSVNVYVLKNYDANLYGAVNVAVNYMEELGYKK